MPRTRKGLQKAYHKKPHVESPDPGPGLNKCFGADYGCKLYVNYLWCRECWIEYQEDPDAFK